MPSAARIFPPVIHPLTLPATAPTVPTENLSGKYNILKIGEMTPLANSGASGRLCSCFAGGCCICSAPLPPGKNNTPITNKTKPFLIAVSFPHATSDVFPDDQAFSDCTRKRGKNTTRQVFCLSADLSSEDAKKKLEGSELISPGSRAFSPGGL